ncbi:MAG TPA: hypothetical protein VK337_18245 [Xanthobacteraceae bacterium]|nr:hypothetical protein [Xanthobacteraceae bacterium]
MTPSTGADKNIGPQNAAHDQKTLEGGAAKPAPSEPMNQADEDVFDRDVSDEALEAASGLRAGEITTLMNGSYCFTCVQEVESKS